MGQRKKAFPKRSGPAGKQPMRKTALNCSVAEEGMPHRAQAPVLDEGERFLHGNVFPSVLCLIHRDGNGCIQLASGEINVLSRMEIAVYVAG